MSVYAVTGEQLTAIADEIRLKTDSTAELTVDDMPIAIRNIETSGTVEGTIVFTGNTIRIPIPEGAKTAFVYAEELTYPQVRASWAQFESAEINTGVVLRINSSGTGAWTGSPISVDENNLKIVGSTTYPANFTYHYIFAV